MEQEGVHQGVITRAFSTVGTNAGDWYIPAFGELAFLSANYMKYNAALEHIRNVYGDSTHIHLLDEDPNANNNEPSVYNFTTSSTPGMTSYDWWGINGQYFLSLLPHVGVWMCGNYKMNGAAGVMSKSQLLRPFCVCTV